MKKPSRYFRNMRAKKSIYLFRLLEQAYVQARYNKDFVVTKEEIERLFIKIELLKNNTKEFCEGKIAEDTCKINR